MTIRISIKNEDDTRSATVKQFQTEEPTGMIGEEELYPGDTKDFYLHGGNYVKIEEAR